MSDSNYKLLTEKLNVVQHRFWKQIKNQTKQTTNILIHFRKIPEQLIATSIHPTKEQTDL